MDNSKRPLQEYFNAARNRPGLSEEEVRAIVGRGGSTPDAGLAPSRRRRILTFGGAIFTVAAVSFGVLRMGSSLSDTSERQFPAASGRAPAGSLHGGAAEAPVMNQARPLTGDTSLLSPAEAMPVLQGAGSYVNSSYDQENHAMMKRTVTTKLAATGAALLGAATLTASAQGTTPSIREQNEKELPVVVQQMQSELGIAVSDYWTPRLNEYKTRIDRSLAPHDLAELNRLRVRFNVLAVQWLGTMGREESVSREQQKEGLEQLIGIYKEAQGMAGRYRSDLDALATTVVDDLGEFLPEVNRRADNFMQLRKSEIDRAGLSAKISGARAKTDEVAAMLRSSQGKSAARMLYSFALEPIVMLYDGTDLSTLLRQMEQLSSGGRGLSLTSGAIAGYTLPDHTVLKPSTPNPASSAVTIGYSLPEPSQQTTLRLYDAQGTLVGTYDEGAREAGEHAVQADVSGLTPGTYLYHLSVRTSAGDRVYSRTLQVVR